MDKGATALPRQLSWTLLGLDFVPDQDGRVWLVDVEAKPWMRRTGLHGGPFDESASRKFVGEQDNFVRAMLVDLVDMVIAQNCHTSRHGENRWRHVGENTLSTAAQPAKADSSTTRVFPAASGDSPIGSAVAYSQESSVVSGVAAVPAPCDDASSGVNKAQEAPSQESHETIDDVATYVRDALATAEDALAKARESGDKKEQASLYICISG